MCVIRSRTVAQSTTTKSGPALTCATERVNPTCPVKLKRIVSRSVFAVALAGSFLALVARALVVLGLARWLALAGTCLTAATGDVCNQFRLYSPRLP